jgi:UDP-glucuronate 4-epimerase
MRALVTGAAGFIGSSIVDQLLKDGHEVVGIDCFTPYYDRTIKDSNLAKATTSSNFTFHEINLAIEPIQLQLEGVTDIFHQAGQPGVRASWGGDFLQYVEWNVWATQQLLEAAMKVETLKSFVAASSSSIYGAAERFPTTEKDLPQPISPYGVTKLAAEHLCSLYRTQFGVPTVSLRYFTVYGPRQRPDMAIHRIIHSALVGEEFKLNGDGQQSRDFTYIDDVVNANIKIAESFQKGVEPSPVYNVGGNKPVSICSIIENIESITGSKIETKNMPNEDGDPKNTGAEIDLIRREIKWEPEVSLVDGLRKQVIAIESSIR